MNNNLGIIRSIGIFVAFFGILSLEASQLAQGAKLAIKRLSKSTLPLIQPFIASKTRLPFNSLHGQPGAQPSPFGTQSINLYSNLEQSIPESSKLSGILELLKEQLDGSIKKKVASTQATAPTFTFRFSNPVLEILKQNNTTSLPRTIYLNVERDRMSERANRPLPVKQADTGPKPKKFKNTNPTVQTNSPVSPVELVPKVITNEPPVMPDVIIEQPTIKDEAPLVPFEPGKIAEQYGQLPEPSESIIIEVDKQKKSRTFIKIDPKDLETILRSYKDFLKQSEFQTSSFTVQADVFQQEHDYFITRPTELNISFDQKSPGALTLSHPEYNFKAIIDLDSSFPSLAHDNQTKKSINYQKPVDLDVLPGVMKNVTLPQLAQTLPQPAPLFKQPQESLYRPRVMHTIPARPSSPTMLLLLPKKTSVSVATLVPQRELSLPIFQGTETTAATHASRITNRQSTLIRNDNANSQLAVEFKITPEPKTLQLQKVPMPDNMGTSSLLITEKPSRSALVQILQEPEYLPTSHLKKLDAFTMAIVNPLQVSGEISTIVHPTPTPPPSSDAEPAILPTVEKTPDFSVPQAGTLKGKPAVTEKYNMFTNDMPKIESSLIVDPTPDPVPTENPTPTPGQLPILPQVKDFEAKGKKYDNGVLLAPATRKPTAKQVVTPQDPKEASTITIVNAPQVSGEISTIVHPTPTPPPSSDAEPAILPTVEKTPDFSVPQAGTLKGEPAVTEKYNMFTTNMPKIESSLIVNPTPDPVPTENLTPTPGQLPILPQVKDLEAKGKKYDNDVLLAPATRKPTAKQVVTPQVPEEPSELPNKKLNTEQKPKTNNSVAPSGLGKFPSLNATPKAAEPQPAAAQESRSHAPQAPQNPYTPSHDSGNNYSPGNYQPYFPHENNLGPEKSGVSLPGSNVFKPGNVQPIHTNPNVDRTWTGRTSQSQSQSKSTDNADNIAAPAGEIHTPHFNTITSSFASQPTSQPTTNPYGMGLKIGMWIMNFFTLAAATIDPRWTRFIGKLLRLLGVSMA